MKQGAPYVCVPELLDRVCVVLVWTFDIIKQNQNQNPPCSGPGSPGASDDFEIWCILC